MSESVPYVRIVKLLSTKQTGRTVVALSAIIKKLNVYQVLEKLKNAVRRYVIRYVSQVIHILKSRHIQVDSR